MAFSLYPEPADCTKLVFASYTYCGPHACTAAQNQNPHIGLSRKQSSLSDRHAVLSTTLVLFLETKNCALRLGTAKEKSKRQRTQTKISSYTRSPAPELHRQVTRVKVVGWSGSGKVVAAELVSQWVSVSGLRTCCKLPYWRFLCPV